MKIAVIDGMGGGIGSQAIERLKSLNSNDIEIIALGTNSQATSNMLKSGAQEGATGENAITWMCQKVDIIIGPLAIIAANSMMGEISPKMSEAIASSPAKKLLLPVSKCNIEVIGLESLQFKTLFNELTLKIKKILEEK
jgi:D-arabinose 1-dehydrogenase-like Zn-dependent alcohol dehydrogenase